MRRPSSITQRQRQRWEASGKQGSGDAQRSVVSIPLRITPFLLCFSPLAPASASSFKSSVVSPWFSPRLGSPRGGSSSGQRRACVERGRCGASSHLYSVPTPEHDDRVSFPQRRRKGRGPFRWKCPDGNRRSGRGGTAPRTARLEDDDRDVAMSDAQDVPRVR